MTTTTIHTRQLQQYTQDNFNNTHKTTTTIHTTTTIYTRQLQQYTRPTNNYTQDNLKLATIQPLSALKIESSLMVIPITYPAAHTHARTHMSVHFYVKGKAVPLQAWSGPEGSGKLRSPDFVTTAQDGGKVVSPMNRPPLPPANIPGTHFC